jgi:hypothetical protein
MQRSNYNSADQVSKFRLVPLRASTTPVRRYACFRGQKVSAPKSDSFFLSAHGDTLDSRTVEYTFARLRKRLGSITCGSYPFPRIQDLRYGVSLIMCSVCSSDSRFSSSILKRNRKLSPFSSVFLFFPVGFHMLPILSLMVDSRAAIEGKSSMPKRRKCPF